MSRWRCKCFFDRPAKHIHALIYGGWLYVEPARPLLEGHGFVIVRQHNYVAMPAWWNRRSGKSLINRPSRCKSKAQRPLGYPYLFCPVFQTHSFTVEREQASLNSVVLLLLSCAPFAVVWLIVAIAVYSVQRVLNTWPWPHVFQKIKKRLSPPFADSDSSSTVPMITSGIGVAASRLHHFPGMVFGGLLACTSMSACFCFCVRGNRIARSHLKLLVSYWVVRAESVHHDRLGSFHCINRGRQVQHI